jgi:hypothetical protein
MYLLSKSGIPIPAFILGSRREAINVNMGLSDDGELLL